MQSVSEWGLLGGHDGHRPVGEFGQDAGETRGSSEGSRYNKTGVMAAENSGLP